jgi:chromosome segregation ATPase
VEDRVAGKKVDCPKCKELILIPLKPPSEKNSTGEDTILRNIIPYRNEMLAKHTKLVEAIEEIKLRNERIRELEACSMRVQKELWSIEVEYEQRREQFDEAENDPHGKGKKTKRKKASSDASKGTSKRFNQTDARPKTPDPSATELNQLAKQIESLTEDCKQLRASRTETDQINTALKAEIGGLVAGVNQREEMTNQAYQQLQQLMESVEAYEKIMLGSNDMGNWLKKQDASLVELGKLAGAFNDRFAKLGEQVEELCSGRDAARQKGPSKAGKKTGGAKTPDKRIAELETELKSAIAKEARIRRKYSELEDLKKSLENKVSSDKDLTNRLANITNNFTKLEQAQLSLQKRAEELGEENQKMKSQARRVNDSTARIAELEGDCHVYRETFKDQEQAYHQLQEKYRQREQVLEYERQLFQRLKAGGGGISDEAEALHKHLMELEKENAELQSEKSQAQNQVSNLSKISTGNAKAVDELKSMRMRLSQLEIDSDDLSAENARLKNTVRTLTENLKAQWKKRDAKVQINR